MKKFLIVSLSLVFLPLYASAQMQNLAASGASRLQEGIFEQQKDAQIRQAQQTYQQNKKIVKEESALTDAEKQQANGKGEYDDIEQNEEYDVCDLPAGKKRETKHQNHLGRMEQAQDP